MVGVVVKKRILMSVEAIGGNGRRGEGRPPSKIMAKRRVWSKSDVLFVLHLHTNNPNKQTNAFPMHIRCLSKKSRRRGIEKIVETIFQI